MDGLGRRARLHHRLFELWWVARKLELPATGWLRRYRVRVHGRPDEEQLAALEDGVTIDGIAYGSIRAKLDRQQASNAWITIGLREGKAIAEAVES